MSIRLFFLAVITSLGIVFIIYKLIQHNKLSEEYSSIWIMIAVVILFGTVFSKQILAVYSLIKGDYGSGPEILLFFALIFVLFFLIFLSIKLSQHKKHIISLSQDVGLLRQEIDKLSNNKRR